MKEATKPLSCLSEAVSYRGTHVQQLAQCVDASNDVLHYLHSTSFSDSEIEINHENKLFVSLSRCQNTRSCLLNFVLLILPLPITQHSADKYDDHHVINSRHKSYTGHSLHEYCSWCLHLQSNTSHRTLQTIPMAVLSLVGVHYLGSM